MIDSDSHRFHMSTGGAVSPSRPTLPSIKRVAKQLGHSVSQLLHGCSSEQLPGSVSKFKVTQSEHIVTFFTDRILTDNR